VVIDKLPSCDCPDASKGNHCKHIMFVFLKVLQVSHRSSLWYQKALLSSELEEIFRGAPRAPNDVADERVRHAYANATGQASSSQPSSADGAKKRVPKEGDDCPICYESMHNVADHTLTYCNSCGNALHKECFQQWAKSAAHNLTCVWCRAKWGATAGASASASGSTVRAATGGEGYIRISGAPGVSPVRDTSSYYQGPQRGRRYYGYQDYEDEFQF